MTLHSQEPQNKIPAFVYGSEVWPVTEINLRWIKTATLLFTIITRICTPRCKGSESCRMELQITSHIKFKITEINWCERVGRIENNRSWKTRRKRNVGRPVKRWTDGSRYWRRTKYAVWWSLKLMVIYVNTSLMNTM